jgi:hypothetical protein
MRDPRWMIPTRPIAGECVEHAHHRVEGEVENSSEDDQADRKGGAAGNGWNWARQPAHAGLQDHRCALPLFRCLPAGESVFPSP